MTTYKKTDRQLITEIKKHDESCFEELINRYSTKIFNLAMRITRNQEDAEDVLQEVCTTVFTKISSFEGKSQFSSWLYRVATNSSFMKIRSRKRRRTVSIEDIEPSGQQNWGSNRAELTDIDTMSTRHELREAIERAVDELPREYKAIFVLRDIDGLSNQSVSEVLELSVPAVKSRLHRSRLLMREKLQPHYDELCNNVDAWDDERMYVV
jgi:RNA polymerase sigma-70 factor (ECF subfamily)